VYTSPALGLRKDEQSGTSTRNDTILVEVMIEAPDRAWWSAHRTKLEQLFRQDEIVVRAIACVRI